MSTLKVYGWTGYRNDARNTNLQHQTREVVAAPSKAAAVRAIVAAGQRPPGRDFGPMETYNHAEVEQAMTKPRTVFWRPLGYGDVERQWYESEATP